MNPVFDFLMPFLSRLGSGEGIFVIAIVVLILNIRKKEKKIAGILLIAGLTISYYSVEALKHWMMRPRPFITLPDVHLLEKAKDFSFPSGHATAAFMAAFILSRFFKRPAVFYTLAVLVCFSRVYLGVHYVSDVLGGAFLGLLIGYALVKLSR